MVWNQYDKKYHISHLFPLPKYKIEFDEKCTNNTRSEFTSSFDGILTLQDLLLIVI
jgi:hypothetical protein